jgi:hypothetical protein
MKVKISTNYVHPIERQTPGGLSHWKGVDFYVNRDIPECDAWVVHEGVSRQESTYCPEGKLFLLTCEPPCIKSYRPAWTEMFSSVVSCHKSILHNRLNLRQTGLPWLVDMSYDELTAINCIPKSRSFSVICSDKRNAPGHRDRYEAISTLAKLVSLDWYGRGAIELENKWDGLAPYRFSIAVENSVVDHYWTEKISDCFLAYTIPLYWGCPNIHEYFPSDSYVKLESLDPLYIRDLLINHANDDEYERRLGALKEARDLVLNKYNLFNLATELVSEPAAPVNGKRFTVVNPESSIKKRKTAPLFLDFLKNFAR